MAIWLLWAVEEQWTLELGTLTERDHFLKSLHELALDENTTFDILEHTFLQMDIVRLQNQMLLPSKSSTAPPRSRPCSSPPPMGRPGSRVPARAHPPAASTARPRRHYKASPVCPRAYAYPAQAHLQGLPQQWMQARCQGVLRPPPSAMPRLLRRRLQKKEVRIFSRTDSRRLRRAEEVSSRQQVAGGRTQRGRAQAEQRLFPLALIGPLALFDAFAPFDACWRQRGASIL